jgi:hypothetical protein
MKLSLPFFSPICFKHLVGVNKEIFHQRIPVLNAECQKHRHIRGRVIKLSMEDLLLATLEYLCEYRTYGVITLNSGFDENNLIRKSRWIEETFQTTSPDQ